MRDATAVVFALLAAVVAAGAADSRGSSSDAGPAGRLCVAALPKNAAAIDKEYRGKKPHRTSTYRFSFRLDDGAWTDLPREDPLLVAGVAAGRKHTLTLRDGEEVIETLPFTFEEKGALDLCLSYTPWYQTWRVEKPKPAAWWCRCGPPDKD